MLSESLRSGRQEINENIPNSTLEKIKSSGNVEGDIYKVGFFFPLSFFAPYALQLSYIPSPEEVTFKLRPE